MVLALTGQVRRELKLPIKNDLTEKDNKRDGEDEKKAVKEQSDIDVRWAEVAKRVVVALEIDDTTLWESLDSKNLCLGDREERKMWCEEAGKLTVHKNLDALLKANELTDTRVRKWEKIDMLLRFLMGEEE